jgi:poly(hydroxyalkanoate) depolymerase family esterase
MLAHALFSVLAPVISFGSNPGALKAYEYIPGGLPANAPLVVVLHGCTQTAAAMQSAGWEALADQYKFAVLFPEQQTANNPVRCFNWADENGDPANVVRGQGENASIIAMIDAQIATHSLDTKRVFVTGLSAGGAFTAVMLATWPDRFAAGSIMAGIPYRCATDLSGAYKCGSPGVTKTPDQWGDLVRAGSAGFSGPWPRVQIWHGSMDTTVATKNADELVKQWTNVHGTDATADTTETIGSATRTAYAADGTVVVESYLIGGMGHAVVVGDDPMGMCTAKAGTFFVDKGICSTLRTAAFFGLLGDEGGTGSGSGSGSGSGGDPESTDDDGGCSASGGAMWLAMLPALALLRRRRPTSRPRSL